MGKSKKTQEKKKKINLVFDETKRKEFLCGFRKRKLERKKKAQEELQRMLKEEKKRIKLENKEAYKKLVVSSRPIPDFDKLLEEEYEDDNVKVKIVELSTDMLEKNDLVIGQNRPKVSLVTKKEKIKKEEKIGPDLPGMGTDIESAHESESENENNDDNLKSKKEIKRFLKHQATKKIQKSKVFQMKSKLDRVKNKKKAQQKKAHGVKGDKKSKGDKRGKGDKKSKGDPRQVKSKKKGGKRKH